MDVTFNGRPMSVEDQGASVGKEGKTKLFSLVRVVMTMFDICINITMLSFLTKRCWPLLDKSFKEQQELNVSCPQVKWGPVYTLFSDYNVVVLYDGTFVEVNQLQRSTQQLLSKICFVTITPPTSPS